MPSFYKDESKSRICHVCILEKTDLNIFFPTISSLLFKNFCSFFKFSVFYIGKGRYDYLFLGIIELLLVSKI